MTRSISIGIMLYYENFFYFGYYGTDPTAVIETEHRLLLAGQLTLIGMRVGCRIHG